MLTSLILFLACILLCEAVGIIGGFATMKSVKVWYRRLKKPPFDPPASIFGPVWTLLYALMGCSLFLIIQSPGNKTYALLFFGLQLALNFLWSFIFFYWHKIGWGFVEILILFSCIILNIIAFFQLNPLAALLLVPYVLWVSFASILNGSIWILNR